MDKRKNMESAASDGALAAGMVCAAMVPAWMWAYDGRVVLAAALTTFGAVWLLGRAVGLWIAVVRGMRKRPKCVEYVRRRPFEEERRLGYVSAEAVCRAAKEVREE